MNRIFKYRYILNCLLLVFFLQCYSLPGQTGKSNTRAEDLVFHSMILPGSLNIWETKTSLSVLFTQLPFDWVETAVEIPLFQINNKLRLPAGFTLESRLQSIIISNQLRVGPHWNYEIGKFSFGAGFDSEFMFGKMQIAGFNNKSWGWSMYPSIMAGCRIKDIAITLNGELTYINSLKITSGNEEISHSGRLFSGISVSMFAEQRLWNDHMMILGFINNFQKIYFPAWPAFSTFNRQYYIPQFYIGLAL
jgi:hypothetical protein